MKLFEVTMRKSANRNAQISVIHSAHSTDLCFADFQVVFVSINLIPFFDICSVLAVLSLNVHPGCSGTGIPVCT